MIIYLIYYLSVIAIIDFFTLFFDFYPPQPIVDKFCYCPVVIKKFLDIIIH